MKRTALKKSTSHRPTWDEYFMEIARTVATRGTCDRGRSGCVVVKDKHILVTGYVGAPKGMPHCDDVGHQIKTVTHENGISTKHCVRTTHAEQNAIVHAAKLGVAIDGSTVYCKMTPCAACAKMIINVGVNRIVCEKRYHVAAETETLFRHANIALEYIDDAIEQYDRQS